jgi:hypothetical protein
LVINGSLLSPKLSPRQLDVLRATLNSLDPGKRHLLSQKLHAQLRFANAGRRPSDAAFDAAMKSALTGLLSPSGEE